MKLLKMKARDPPCHGSVCIIYDLGHVDPDRLGDLRPTHHALGHTGGAGGAGDQVAARQEHHPHLAVVMSV